MQAKNNILELLTPKAIKVIQLARAEAQRLNLPSVEPAHLFIGLIEEGTTTAAKALRIQGVSLKQAREEARNISGHREQRSDSIPLSKRSQQLIEQACARKQTAQDQTDTTDLLVALIHSEDSQPADESILKRLALNKTTLLEALASAKNNEERNLE
jgi:ATP-dependent Clp protease ATP-binding subunit ClpC